MDNDAKRLLFSEIKSSVHMAIVTSGEIRAGSRDIYGTSPARQTHPGWIEARNLFIQRNLFRIPLP
jgi:hypothetical protein